MSYRVRCPRRLHVRRYMAAIPASHGHFGGVVGPYHYPSRNPYRYFVHLTLTLFPFVCVCVCVCVDRKRNCNPNLYLAPNLNPLTLTPTLTLAPSP